MIIQHVDVSELSQIISRFIIKNSTRFQRPSPFKKCRYLKNVCEVLAVYHPTATG